MDTAKRDSAARALIAASGSVYGGVHGKDFDLDTVQSIENYADPMLQLKYVHMYFAKYVTLWRVVRQRLNLNPNADLYSIGAGPCLDLFGWFWDQGPSTGVVRGIDAQPWSEIHALTEWRQLKQLLVPTLDFQAGYVVPAPEHVRQAAGLKGTKPFPSSNIAKGTTVLFPFSLNHCFGVKDSTATQGRKAVGDWIAELRARGAHIVIGDMHQLPSTKVFWNILRETLRVTDPAVDLEFEPNIKQLGHLYADGQAYRRASRFMSKATVLVLDPQRAWFLK